MTPNDPTVKKRQARIKALLCDKGLRIRDVAKRVRLTVRRVTEIAKDKGYPTNPQIIAGGEIERQIFEAHAAGVTLGDLVEIYRQAPINIRGILNTRRKSLQALYAKGYKISFRSPTRTKKKN